MMINTSFDENGFLHIPGAFPEATMHSLKKLIERLLQKHKHSEEILYEDGYPKKLLYCFNKDACFLRLLASDSILDLIFELSVDLQQIVPTWEDMIIKLPKINNALPPHQDLPLQSFTGMTFSISVSITGACNNPVYFMPGSHRLGPLTRSEIKEVFLANKAEFIPIHTKVGDLVAHNAMTIHYSESNDSDQSRYTWYLEFRTIDQLKYDSPWDDEWIAKRRAIFLYAIEQYNPNRLSEFGKDINHYRSYFNPIQLKVPHVTQTVDYDMESPFYHF